MKLFFKKRKAPMVYKDKAIIVDIDGTLANIDHRRYLVEGKKKDWDKFSYEAINDTPNKAVVKICNELKNDFTILFVSGRQEKLRSLTDMQIKSWTFSYSHELFMRKNDDFRSDVDLKLEIYKQEIKDKYDVLFAIDDNKDIVNIWRNLNVFTFDCAGYERKQEDNIDR